MSNSTQTIDWDRECVICGDKWLSDSNNPHDCDYCNGRLPQVKEMSLSTTREFTGDLTSLAQAITEFELTLPGWWWEIGSCSISANAHCGPDILGPDAELIMHNEKAFAGFSHQGSTCADALRGVMKDALKAKAAKMMKSDE